MRKGASSIDVSHSLKLQPNACSVSEGAGPISWDDIRPTSAERPAGFWGAAASGNVCLAEALATEVAEADVAEIPALVDVSKAAAYSVSSPTIIAEPPLLKELWLASPHVETGPAGKAARGVSGGAGAKPESSNASWKGYSRFT
jgi:hypothetical protein